MATVIVKHHPSGGPADPLALVDGPTYDADPHIVAGLENVDNTADVNKPISTAQQGGLNLKANLAGLNSFIGTDAAGGGQRFYRANATNYTEIYKGSVGLGSTADPLNFYSDAAGAVIASLGRDGAFQILAGFIGTSFNGNAWTAGTGTLTLGAAKTLTASNTLTLTGTDGSSVAFGTGGTVLYNGGALGTPSSGVATNLTGTASGLTAGNVTTNANLTGAVTSVGNATSLGSFTSAQLAGALTNETGSGAAVFGTSPTIATPTITGLITASGGQIAFPATQNPSVDPNTLDDYEEGTWTPVLTFATPGNFSVTYSLQDASYTKIGNRVCINFIVSTSAFTFTTASGNILITGLPFASSNASANARWYAPVLYNGVTKAGYGSVIGALVPNTSQLQFLASGSGVTVSNVVAADTPTGGSVILAGELTYNV